MNLIKLSWGYTKSKPLNTFLNILLMSLGIAIVLVLLLLNSQLDEKLSKNQRGIDLVVGAKGSPLQLILANVYHIDFPTGNIKLEEAKKLVRNRLIKKAIPLALGDNHGGFRIVGTNHEYVHLYNGIIEEGQLWKHHTEVTIGANVAKNLKLDVGDEFYGAHGIGASAQEHDELAYKVVGVLKKTNGALDNLILTNIESVWLVHDHDEEEEHDHDEEEEHDHDEEHEDPALEEGSAYAKGLPEGDADAEITSLLIQYRSPMGAVQMPRIVNNNTNMQAASPAFETARLFSLLGIGINTIRSFAYIIIVISGLSIFIALYNALKERKYDLAIMRSLGASRLKLFIHVILEGVIITTLGGLLGFAMGHILVEFLAKFYEKSEEMGITGFTFVGEELSVFLLSIGVGILAALIPAMNAYRTDISRVLAKE